MYRFFPQGTVGGNQGYYIHQEAINAAHAEGVINVFTDGHAKWLKITAMMDPVLWFP